MRVTIDLMKKSTEIIDLSNVINPRVGDDDLQLPLHICYGDSLFDMRGKDVEFLTQDTNKNNIYIAGTCNTDTPGDNLYMGNLTFRFPANTFKADGTYDPDKTMFRIVDKATNKVISSVNVKITVMKNNIEFDFDPNQSSYDSRAETMLQDFHDKGQMMLDKIEELNNQAKSNVSGDTAATANQAKQQANANAGNISDLKGEVAGARGRFADLPGREDAQDTAISQKETIVNANANYATLQQKDAQQDAAIAQKAGKFELEDKLSQMDLQPEAFENEAALKAKYPNGKVGFMVTVDTGHKWVWINGAWKDCGIYQAAGVDDAIATRITAATEQTKHGFDKELDQETTDRIAGDQQLRSDLDGLATIKNAVELKDIDLLDDDGNPLTDQDGQHVAVQNYLPKTDMIGNQKGLPIDSSLVGDTFLSNLTKYGLPVLYLDDDRVFGLQTKKDKLSDVPYHWVNAPGDLKGEGLIKKLKVQGNSSSTFPKKSYKFTLDNPGTAKVGWVSSDEYAVKAYWADFSHLRDIGVSHLWAQIRRDRITAENSVLISDDGALSDQSGNALAVETDPSLTAGTTFGTIDGFPIFLVIDGKYNGFYDLIVPKSPEMAKMPDRHSTTHRAIISAEPGDICGFQQEPALNDDGTLDDGNGWSIEFVQDEDDQKWVGDAVKKLYDVISADYANADDFTAAVSPYVDLDSAIDLWLLVIATQSNDEVTHNFLMQTYDGKKWYFAPYDNDITFGLNDWHGTKVQKANTSNAWIGSRQKLWGQLTKHCADKIKARWDALRSPQGALSELNVWYVINTLAMALPVGVYEAESKRWPAIPGTAAKDASQIITYYDLWIKKQDDFIAKY